MKICFLSSMHTPLDKRVFDKEAVSLAAAGFQVTHIAPDATEGEAVARGVHLVKYPRPKGLMGRVLQLPLLYSLARRENADVYHCNEVDSWLVGVMLKIFRKKRLVFDVHEHYPSTFAESRFPAVVQPAVAGIVRLVMRLFSRFTDRIVLAKRSVAVDFEGHSHPPVLAQNFARTDHGSSRHVHSTDQGMTLIHLGLVSRSRGWPQLLEALTLADSKDIKVRCIGEFNDGSLQAFLETAEQLGLKDRVQAEPWLPYDQAFTCVLESDVGLVLFQPGIQNNKWALPHKMFDYMLAGLPVIAPAFADEVATIVQESDAGLLVDPADPASIAEALNFLSRNPEERSRLGENGRQAVFQRYNWEAEAKKLMDMYHGFEHS